MTYADGVGSHSPIPQGMKQAWRRSRPQTSRGPQSASCARVDRAPGQRPEGPPPPRRGPIKPQVPGPAKQPPGVSRCIPERPAPDTKNHQRTDI
ncbi:homeobox protein Hox-A3-like [Oreochromis niloticus]|uniref:homeobox protein Hox-A3-like n=1 Tax=Oreochromis niloticus TaxID=8128 RepID=UPI0003945944|nr:homeobox protein Hox-A3-like [Oreochromis niloticus]